MSFTYSGDPNSGNPIDKYRFLLMDTTEENAVLSDEEIVYIVDTHSPHENRIAYELFSRAAVLFARDIRRSLGPQSEDPTHRAKFFADKAAEYKALLSNMGMGRSINAYPKIFRKGMHSNPRYPQPTGSGPGRSGHIV